MNAFLPAARLASWLALNAGAAPRCVLLVSTNDLHGHLTPRSITDAKGTRELGGLARFGAILAGLRAGKEPVLLLDAGDLFQGTLESNFQHGRAVISAYNELRYDAATLGNHEFDFGPEPGSRPDAAADGPQGAIRRRLGEAHFPFLAANLVDAATGKLPTWSNLAASKLFALGGVKVGVIGIANPDTPAVTVRKYVAGLEFQDPVEPIVREAKALRARGADLLVLLAHIGGSCDPENADPATSCERPSQLLSTLDRLPPGTIDVAFGGHTHRFIDHWISGVATLEAGAEGKYFSQLEACALPAKQGGGLDRAHTHLQPPREVTWGSPGGVGAANPPASSGVAEDSKVAAVVQPYLDAVAAEVKRPLGPVLAAPLRRDYHALSPLGAMVAEAIRRQARADVGLVNAGGLRADLPAGPLTYGALYEAFPFQNDIVLLDLSGAQLANFVNALGGSGHGHPQTAGFALEGEPGHFQLVGPDGGRLDPDKRYRLGTIDFLLHGGDGTQPVVDGFSPAQLLPLQGSASVRDAILAYLSAGSTAAAPGGPDGDAGPRPDQPPKAR